jgi:DNA-directed RNA polymerase subunit RPC12/RpoP
MSEWICHRCTEPNPPSAMRCEACGAERYLKKRPVITPVRMTAASRTFRASVQRLNRKISEEPVPAGAHS